MDTIEDEKFLNLMVENMVREMRKEAMISKIITYENDKETITQKSKEVDFNSNEINIKQVCEDLIDTLKATETGVGISAIQIGIPYKICIIKYNGKYIPMVNPVITRTRGITTFNEGCLSAPGERRNVTRAQKVWCTYYTPEGEQQDIAEGGLCSIIIQHELDHFDGWCEVFNNYEERED